ncbi:phosphatase PAP2 family protein [Streptomyces longispororuber]|uniref:phosphatase PAP2 family protein n=1 Tax=Streptomyces longispororuber TaxID=68230 RepID=UPI0033C67DBD
MRTSPDPAGPPAPSGTTDSDRPARWWPGPLVLGALFAVLTWQVVRDTPLRRLDERLGDGLRGGPPPRPLAELLADLGNMTVALPVLAAAVAYTAWQDRRAGAERRWAPPLAAAGAMAAVPLLVVPLKVAVDRGAPPGMDGTGYYPSGHTATATVAYGTAALLLAGRVRAPRALALACVLVNLGVGLGLVVRGYHWPADVLASWLLGGVLLLVAARPISRSTGRSSSRTPRC